MKQFYSILLKPYLLLGVIGGSFFFHFQALKAQDYNFNQYHFTPLLTNPAMVAQNDDSRLFMNYRNQPTIINENFQNIMISGMHPFLRKKDGRRWGGIGATFVNDQNGRFLKVNAGMLALAYNLKLGENHYLGLGLQGGYFQRRIDFSSETTSSQWDESTATFNDNLGLGEEAFNNTSNYLSFGGGLWWQLEDEEDRAKIWLSIAAHNVNQPDISFYNEVSSPLKMQVTYAGAVRVFQNERFEIMPTFRVVSRSKQDQFNIGSWFRYRFREEEGFLKKGHAGLGLWYNFNNAFVPSLELVQPRYFAAFSFDVATSNNAQLWQGNSTFELTVGVKFPPKLKKDMIPFLAMPTLPHQIPSIPDNTQPIVELQGVKIVEEQYVDDGNFRFAIGSSALDARSEALLDSVVKVLKQFPNATLDVAGHTCDIGLAERNLVLSKNRAATMKKYLIAKGIEGERISTLGFGEEKPLVPNTNEANRRLNRRVAFKIYHETRRIDLKEE